MKNAYLKEKMSLIPKKPGCYLWKNANDDVIYVGKAKNLYNRTHQYFDKNRDYKTRVLVNEISDVDYIVVNNENESLILENNLIKKYWPKYNILLKDSSEYPYILVTDEKDPRILYTRQYKKMKGKYYGPLADASFKRYKIYELLNTVVPFRKCAHIPNQKCLYYDIGQCLGPCINKINPEEYKKWKNYVKDLFQSKNTELKKQILLKEQAAAKNLDFEQANSYKEMADGLESIVVNQVMEITNHKNADYLGYVIQDNYICFVIFSYFSNKLLTKHNSIHEFYNDDINQVVTNFANQYYSINMVPDRVIISLDENDLKSLSEIYNKTFSVPKSNQEREVMQTVVKNAQTYLNQHLLTAKKRFERTTGAANELAKLLNIPSANTIEIFDNSNINLEDPVSGMVVFVNGSPNKKLYRHYKLVSTDKDSDYHFMKQVIYRRYDKLLKLNKKLPDLIIVDGGMLQINAAKESLVQLGIWDEINIIGLKKDNHHKTNVIVKKDLSEITVDKRSSLFFFLENMQDEVHNFAINFFRKTNLKSHFKSVLDEIEGLGKVRRNKLLQHYQTLDEIKKATLNELAQIIPLNVAENLKAKLEVEEIDAKMNKELKEADDENE